MNCRLYIVSYCNASHALDEQLIDERISEALALEDDYVIKIKIMLHCMISSGQNPMNLYTECSAVHDS